MQRDLTCALHARVARTEQYNRQLCVLANVYGHDDFQTFRYSWAGHFLNCARPITSILRKFELCRHLPRMRLFRYVNM